MPALQSSRAAGRQLWPYLPATLWVAAAWRQEEEEEAGGDGGLDQNRVHRDGQSRWV